MITTKVKRQRYNAWNSEVLCRLSYSTVWQPSGYGYFKDPVSEAYESRDADEAQRRLDALTGFFPRFVYTIEMFAGAVRIHAINATNTRVAMVARAMPFTLTCHTPSMLFVDWQYPRFVKSTFNVTSRLRWSQRMRWLQTPPERELIVQSKVDPRIPEGHWITTA